MNLTSKSIFPNQYGKISSIFFQEQYNYTVKKEIAMPAIIVPVSIPFAIVLWKNENEKWKPQFKIEHQENTIFTMNVDSVFPIVD